LDCKEYGIVTRLRRVPYITGAGKKFSFIHIEELFGKQIESFTPSASYLADYDFCEIVNLDESQIDEGSEDEADEPTESNFFVQHKEKFIVGGLAALVLGTAIYAISGEAPAGN
jgi:hypothetical protein